MIVHSFCTEDNYNHPLITCFNFVLRLNVPVNNFSVMSGRSQRFLGLTSTVRGSFVLLKDTTRCRLWGSNTEPLDSESDALPLRHSALHCFNGKSFTKATGSRMSNRHINFLKR